jgi:hypothetical protein
VQVSARKNAALEARLVSPPPPRLALAHQARVADAINGEDRGEATGSGQSSGTPALRMPSKTGLSWARYVGSSLLAVQVARTRETV